MTESAKTQIHFINFANINKYKITQINSKQYIKNNVKKWSDAVLPPYF